MTAQPLTGTFVIMTANAHVAGRGSKSESSTDAVETNNMYAVSIRYPRNAGEEFDFHHWADVHMPLGIATFNKVNGIHPKQVMVQHETFGMDGKPESTDAYATVWLLFDTRAGLDGFMNLHNDPIASAGLSRDFRNYAPLPPHIALGEVMVFEDMDAVLKRGESLLDCPNRKPS